MVDMTNPIFLPTEPPAIRSRKLFFSSLSGVAAVTFAMVVLTVTGDEMTIVPAGFALLLALMASCYSAVSSLRSPADRVRRGLAINSAMRAAVDNHYALVLDTMIIEDRSPAGRSTPTPATFSLPDGRSSRHLLSFEPETGRPIITDMLESLVPAASLKRERPLNESGK